MIILILLTFIIESYLGFTLKLDIIPNLFVLLLALIYYIRKDNLEFIFMSFLLGFLYTVVYIPLISYEMFIYLLLSGIIIIGNRYLYQKITNLYLISLVVLIVYEVLLPREINIVEFLKYLPAAGIYLTIGYIYIVKIQTKQLKNKLDLSKYRRS